MAQFEADLRVMVHSAQGLLIGKLQGDIIVTNGVIEPTPGNLRSQRGIGRAFEDAMRRAGYPQLVRDFAATFDGNFVYFNEIMGQLAAEGVIPSDAVASIGKIEQKLLSSQLITSQDALNAVVSQTAETFAQQALYNVGALRFSDLVARISPVVEGMIPRAVTIATTAQTMFFRKLSRLGFDSIENDLGEVGHYIHSGPIDVLTRPMCVHWIKGQAYSGPRGEFVLPSSDATYTMEEISSFSNGQLPDCTVTMGGFNCRGQLILKRMEKRLAVAA